MGQGLPPLLPLWWAAMRPRRRPDWRDADDVVVSAERVYLEHAHLERFLGVVGGQDPPAVALTFPYAVVTPLHLAVVTSDAFPLPTFGLVHRSERIRRWRTLAIGTAVDVVARATAFREVPGGVRFDLHTTLEQDGQVVWDSVTTAQARSGRGSPRPYDGDAPRVGWSRELVVPGGAGRAYGVVASNLDPIHVSRWTALPFGFPRAVVHGMWTVARSVAELGEPLGPATLDVRFRSPLFVPGRASLFADPVGGDPPSRRFGVWRAGASRPVLEGRLTAAVVDDATGA